jgi:starvation-inducible DNA-binding protein
MYTSRIDLHDNVRSQSIAVLQARLADAIDLQSQMKQAHWNVKGPRFISLHDLFDRLYGEVGTMVDDIAERIVALGGVADGRLQTVVKTTSLYEYALEAEGGEAHTKAVAAVLAQFGKSVRTAIDQTAEFGDAGTADLFTGMSRAIDKSLWFVEAHMGAAS